MKKHSIIEDEIFRIYKKKIVNIDPIIFTYNDKQTSKDINLPIDKIAFLETLNYDCEECQIYYDDDNYYIVKGKGTLSNIFIKGIKNTKLINYITGFGNIYKIEGE